MQNEVLNAMNELVKKDISDILQVNIPSWFTLGWVNDWNFSALLQINLSTTQEVLSVILLVLTIGFTAFKIYRAYRHFMWAKEDRLEEEAE